MDGGMEAASELIHRVLLDKGREEAVEERRRDFKTELQELVQRKSGSTLGYRLPGRRWRSCSRRKPQQQRRICLYLRVSAGRKVFSTR